MVKVVYLSKETLHGYFLVLVISEQSTEFPAIFLKCRLPGTESTLCKSGNGLNFSEGPWL